MPAAVFLLFTFSAFVMFFALPKSDFSVMEKRYLSKTPDFSIENLTSGELVKQIDGDSEKGKVGYVADHFPLRSFFVGLNSYYNLCIGNTANSDYYFAKDGFVITKPYDTPKLDTNIKVINEFSKDKNVTLAVVPSAGYVLEDKLPLNHLDYSDEAVYKSIETDISDSVTLCDMRSLMLDYYAKGNAPYYKTDHHWTTPAAFEAYKEISVKLGLEPTDESVFKKTSYSDFCGTTYSSSGYFLVSPDSIEVWKNEAQKGVKVEITEGPKTEKYDSMFFEEHLSEPDMYPVFLDGNHPLVTIRNPEVKGGKLLVIKDSFAHALVPFLADNYSEIYMVDMRYYKENLSKLCTENEISDVLILYSISNFCTDTGLAFLE